MPILTSLENFSRRIENNKLLLRIYKSLCFLLFKPKDIRKTLIFINNRNHYSYLKDLINWLEYNEFTNYYVIDNDSSYPPLIEYYETRLKDRVIYLNKNIGHLSIWKQGIINKFKNSFYVYTDSDIVPVLESNPLFLEKLYEGLKTYKFSLKAGCAIKIDDLPEHFNQKENVIQHERQFWARPLTQDIYHAAVDTTFALYLPNYVWSFNNWRTHLRIAGICTVRHQPWYENSNNLTEEQIFYKNSSQTLTHWTNIDQEVHKQ